MVHVSFLVKSWGVAMLIPGPVDATALLFGGIIGLYAYNVFALGVYVSGEVGMWDDIGHPTMLEEQAEVAGVLAFDQQCSLDDPPWWCA